jgi:hypothetical protein
LAGLPPVLPDLQQLINALVGGEERTLEDRTIHVTQADLMEAIAAVVFASGGTPLNPDTPLLSDLTFALEIRDAEGNLLTQPPITFSGTPSAGFSFTPPENYSGALQITATVSDNDGNTSAPQEFTVDILPDLQTLAEELNGGPLESPEDEIINVTNATVNQALAQVAQPAGQSGLGIDPNTPVSELTFTLVVKDDQGTEIDTITFSGDPNEDKGFSFVPPQDYNGKLTVEVTVSDGQNTSSAQSFTFDVTPVNDAPVITSNSGGDTGTVTVTA